MIFVKTKRKAIAGMMLGSSVLCLIPAVVSFVYYWNFVSHAARANGQITGFSQLSDVYCPIFEFNDDKGNHHTIHSNAGSSQPRHQIGDKIAVLYTPNNPGDAAIDDFYSIWMMPFVTGIIGAFYFLVGLIVWFWPKIFGRIGKIKPVTVSP